MKLKLLLATCLLFLLFSFSLPKSIPNFEGNWNGETKTSAFSLKLEQKNNQVTGNHCSVQKSGDKIDCVEDESEESLFGSVQNDTYVIVTFKSQISLNSGTAKITKIDNNTIDWQILTKPKGEYQIPNHIILEKE
ncbi:MAG: hypothetical protein NTZ47_01805 [Bacteroidetes bacterium]|nr:hypothetical protein [Bacteroidota bacterium]